ncbi:di-heme oxidoredictase family protein [Anderseniella sp. Alg231-50]|uniref:di-heme oxidoredictase family protein n=1 Tax=Anderseniella sp. Alg231-50 TaxID=1922226 RepID=UPI000D5582B7
MTSGLRRRYLPILAGAGAIGWLLLWQAPELQAGSAAFVPGEEMPGGEATSRRSAKNANAFSHASGNAGFDREFDFKIGNGIFRKLWVSAPASTNSSDGLGPLYNARACQRCHLKDGRGHPPENLSDNAVSMLLRVGIPLSGDKPPVKPDPVYGGQIQDFAIQGHKPEARIELRYEEFAVELSGGETVMLRRPKIELADLAYGAMHPDVRLSARIANQMIGLGLLEAISAPDILANADPEDADGDGISGRPNMVMNLEAGMAEPGRFGWKAGQPTVRQQSAAAFSGDMGLSTSLITPGAGDCTEPQAACLQAKNGADPAEGNVEVPDEMLDLVAFYARNLAVPKRSDAQSDQVLAGKALFSSAGCAACHVPSFRTLDSRDVAPEQKGQTIWPYTDLLLHDMGDGLADGLPEGQALGREWRTAPLWGIGATEIVSGHTLFLHDGRARNLTEAILWHGGEAQAARDAFAAMTPKERADLIAFVSSL